MNDQNISLAATAALAGVDPSWLCRHRDHLPTAVPTHTGQHGRPQLAFSSTDLIEFALEQTQGLTEIELRLRLAIALATQKRHRKTVGFRTGPVGADGLSEMVPVFSEPNLEPQP